MSIHIGTHQYSLTGRADSAHDRRKDRMISGGELVAQGQTASGTQYMVRSYDFGLGTVWHVFAGGMWHSAHTQEEHALGVLRRVNISI